MCMQDSFVASDANYKHTTKLGQLDQVVQEAQLEQFPAAGRPCNLYLSAVCRAKPGRCIRRQENVVAIDLITEHIRMKLQQPELRRIYVNLEVIPSNYQIRGMHTIIRDASTSKADFVFYADRLLRLVRPRARFRVGTNINRQHLLTHESGPPAPGSQAHTAALRLQMPWRVRAGLPKSISDSGCERLPCFAEQVVACRTPSAALPRPRGRRAWVSMS